MADGSAQVPELSWLVVTHDDGRHLRRLLPALAEVRERHAALALQSELILADNASRDDSRQVAQQLAPGATLLGLPANCGYGGALNAAAAVARGRWLACVNADLLPTRVGFAALPAVLAAAPPSCAVIGPALFDATGRRQPSVGRWPSLPDLLTGLLRRPEHRRTLPVRRHVRGFVPWVSAACLFVRAEALAQAGGFRPEYFVYYTEVDLARRLQAAGRRILYEPALQAGHAAPLHGRPRDRATAEHVRAARRAYFRHHRPGWEQSALAVLESIERRLRPGRESPPAGQRAQAAP